MAAAECDPYATIRSSSSHRKAPGQATIAATASSQRQRPGPASGSSSSASRAASPTPSNCSASSSSSSNAASSSSYRRRRTSAESVTTDWTGSVPRTTGVVKDGSASIGGEAALLRGPSVSKRSGTLIPSARTRDAQSTTSSRASKSSRPRIEQFEPISGSHGHAHSGMPSTSTNRWSTWTADSTLHSESHWSCTCHAQSAACSQCDVQDQYTDMTSDKERRLAQKTLRPSMRSMAHSRSRSTSITAAEMEDRSPLGEETTLFRNASAALDQVRAQLSDASIRDEDEEGETSDASTDPAQRAAFEQLFRATVSALEQSNALLLSTLNSRSQLASLRAQQGAVERDMNARELELRRRLEANRDMAEWVRHSAEQLEDVVRELDADRLRAAGGVAAPHRGGAGGAGWGFSRPTHWRVPSLSGLGSVFSGGDDDSPGPSSAGLATLEGVGVDADGNLTMGKTAAKRLERVLIKHKRGQSSLSIASSVQSQNTHARNTSTASSFLETPATSTSDGQAGSSSASLAASPLPPVRALSEDPLETEEDALEASMHSERKVKTLDRGEDAQLESSPVLDTPRASPTAPPRPPRIVRPGKPGLGLRLGPAAAAAATVSTTLSSPTVVVSPSQGASQLEVGGGPLRSGALGSRRTESRASLTSIEEDAGSGLGSGSGRRSPAALGRFPIKSSPAMGLATSTTMTTTSSVDRAVSPGPSSHHASADKTRRAPSLRGSISSLNSVSSVRSERAASLSGSMLLGVTSAGVNKPPRALAVAASAPASRLEVPMVLSAPLASAWSASELGGGGGSGLPELGVGGASGTLSALLSRAPSASGGAGAMSRSTSAASGAQGLGQGDGVDGCGSGAIGGHYHQSEGDEEGEEYVRFLRSAAPTSANLPGHHGEPSSSATTTTTNPSPSPLAAGSRRLSAQSNASKLSTSAAALAAHLRSPRLVRLDSGVGSSAGAVACAEMASVLLRRGGGGGGGDWEDGEEGWDGEEGGEKGRGWARGRRRSRGALAALKALNGQKGVLPGGPELDGAHEAGAGAGVGQYHASHAGGGGGGGGAWASLTSWVGFGMGGGGGAGGAGAGTTEGSVSGGEEDRQEGGRRLDKGPEGQGNGTGDGASSSSAQAGAGAALRAAEAA